MPAFWLVPLFWYVLAILTFVGITYKLPFVGRFVKQLLPNKRTGAVILVVIGLFVGGVFVSLLGGTPASTTGGVAGAMSIAMIDYKAGTSHNTTLCAIGEDTVRSNIAYIRAADTGVLETASSPEFDGNLTIVRTDSSKAGSCKVTASVTSFRSPSDSSDVNSYKITEETSGGELEVYLEADRATTSSQKEEFYLDFAEGVSTEVLGVYMEIDEEAADELNIYDTKNVVLTFCDGSRYTFEYMELDAAA